MNGKVLTGERAVVTGGSRGIGNAIVAAFIEAGARVCYLSRQTADNHTQLSSRAQELGTSVDWVETDMSMEDSITRALEQAEKLLDGNISILVNNAGITRDGLTMRMKREQWDEVLNVNLTGAFLACQRVVRKMARARSGVIINISSVVGLVGNAGQANYAASKAGLIGLTKSLAREFASRSVRVNAVAPGYIKTDMTSSLSDEIQQQLTQTIPLAFLGDPEHVAQAVLFLASADASYITGQVLAVDGGMTM
ncbi:MAG: 3-oxoacyl-[acyl-carrier-protein] reductase [Spirochaetota bacterium]